jgi:inosine-uridine nucleoside N-ribohydrolase
MGPTHKDYYFSKDGLGLHQQVYVDKLKAEKRWRADLLRENAVDFIVESINAHPGEVAIIAIGPLTNLALAYHTDNSIGDKLGLLSLMGGSISAFGIREFFAAEFNFYLDAEAAHIAMKVQRPPHRSSRGLSSTPSICPSTWAPRRRWGCSWRRMAERRRGSSTTSTVRS